MSTKTQTLNRLTSKMGAISYQSLHGQNHVIDQRQTMGIISYQCLHGHMHQIDKFQTNGHNQISMLTWTQACNYQCQLNGHDPQAIYQNSEPLLSRSKQR